MKIISEKKICSTPRFDVIESTYEDMADETKEWYHVRRPDTTGVALVPFLMTPEGPRLVIIKEFRIPIGSYVWALPGGVVDKGETIVEAAKRELKEETGYDLVKVMQVSPAVCTSPHIVNEYTYIIMCMVEGSPSNRENEETEDIKIHTMSNDQLQTIMGDKSNKISSLVLLASWLMPALF